MKNYENLAGKLNFVYAQLMKTRKIINLICAFLFVFPTFCNEFTDYEKKVIHDIMEFRFTTRSFANADEAIQKTKDFHEKILQEEVQSQLGDEAKIIADNLLVLQQYDYIYEKDIKSPLLEPFITAQYEKIEAWNQNHPFEQQNPYYVLSSGDLINSTMQFLPQNKAINLGLREKKEYDALLEKYPDLGFANINAALWYYFAPAIGGGSDVKAKKLFEKAVECAGDSYEKFYAAVYYSQFLYEKDDMEGCEKYLSQAEAMLPGNRYTAFIRRINKIKYSILDYSNNRKTIDAKLEKQGQ